MKNYAPRIRLDQKEYETVMRMRGDPTTPTAKPAPPNFTKIPKILIIDVETLFAKGEFWHTGKQRIGHQQITQESVLLSWSCKWLYDSEVFGDVLTSEEAVARDDKRILQSVWKFLDEADCVIGHNVKAFDIRFLNGRFWRHGINSPTSYTIIDTLIEYRKTMRILSYKLDYISLLIQQKGKLGTSYELWQKCDKGDTESLGYMLKYNKEDVLLGEEAYLEILPFIKSHPNLYVIGESGEKCCPSCGSTDLQETNKFYYTPAGRFRVIRCNAHGCLSRERLSDLTQEEKKNLLISIAR